VGERNEQIFLCLAEVDSLWLKVPSEYIKASDKLTESHDRKYNQEVIEPPYEF